MTPRLDAGRDPQVIAHTIIYIYIYIYIYIMLRVTMTSRRMPGSESARRRSSAPIQTVLKGSWGGIICRIIYDYMHN